MECKEMITRRKSVRKYTADSVDAATIAQIERFCTELKPLDPSIRVRWEILDKKNVKCILPWIPRQTFAIFSEAKEGYLENVGFMFQQLDLYLQSVGLGACWLGMGHLHDYVENPLNDGLEFVIMLTFGHPKEDFRSGADAFSRRSAADISDTPDPVLEPARLAPSSVNSQPWYFTHSSGAIHAYCIRRGLFKGRSLVKMNRIDMGIALAHMYVSHPDTFRYFKAEHPAEIKNHDYIGSFTL